MNWYRRLKIAQIQGEFWIMDNTVMSADDWSEQNHEGQVIASVQSQIMDSYMPDEDWEEWKQQKAQETINERAQELMEATGINDPDDLHEEALMLYLQEAGVSDEDYAIAEGFGDAREYGMKNWGWKRLEGHNVETWSLTRGDLSSIASGLWDAYNEEAEKASFNIYVYSAQKWYRDVPWAVLEAENPMALREYQDMVLL